MSEEFIQRNYICGVDGFVFEKNISPPASLGRTRVDKGRIDSQEVVVKSASHSGDRLALTREIKFLEGHTSSKTYSLSELGIGIKGKVEIGFPKIFKKGDDVSVVGFSMIDNKGESLVAGRGLSRKANSRVPIAYQLAGIAAWALWASEIAKNEGVVLESHLDEILYINNKWTPDKIVFEKVDCDTSTTSSEAGVVARNVDEIIFMLSDLSANNPSLGDTLTKIKNTLEKQQKQVNSFNTLAQFLKGELKSVDWKNPLLLKK